VSPTNGNARAMSAPSAATRIVAITIIVLATAVSGEAQQQAPVHRIGVLLAVSQQAPSGVVAEFKTALRDLGYAEGRNLIIEWRSAESRRERLSSLAADLVGLNVELIVAEGNEATAAVMKVTSTIPTVMMAFDPVGAGFIKSLSRPGGNVTGINLITPELAGKILEVLKDAVPKVSLVSVLFDRSYLRMDAYEAETRAAASRLGITLDLVDVKTPGDVARALARVERARPSALYVVTLLAVREKLPDIIEFAARRRVPAIYTTPAAVRLGGLMSYSPSFTDAVRRLAWYVDKVLKGTKPADLPVEEATRFDLVINRKTATALGFTVPPSVLLRATEIIE